MPEASKAPAPVAQAAAEPATSASKLARGTVAKGRTVMAQTGERRTINYTADGTPITRLAEQAYRPGQEIELPEHEIKRLRAAGFLVDPNAAVVKSDIGPSFDRTD